MAVMLMVTTKIADYDKMTQIDDSINGGMFGHSYNYKTKPKISFKIGKYRNDNYILDSLRPEPIGMKHLSIV
jgi:hypothetical protein